MITKEQEEKITRCLYANEGLGLYDGAGNLYGISYEIISEERTGDQIHFFRDVESLNIQTLIDIKAILGGRPFRIKLDKANNDFSLVLI